MPSDSLGEGGLVGLMAEDVNVVLLMFGKAGCKRQNTPHEGGLGGALGGDKGDFHEVAIVQGMGYFVTGRGSDFRRRIKG